MIHAAHVDGNSIAMTRIVGPVESGWTLIREAATKMWNRYTHLCLYLYLVLVLGLCAGPAIAELRVPAFTAYLDGLRHAGISGSCNAARRQGVVVERSMQMDYSLTYDRDADCVVLVSRGTVNIDFIKEVAPKVARLCEESGCQRILNVNDMSAATVDVSLLDLFDSPHIMDKSGISRLTKRALVLPSGFPEAHFLEVVTRNRGHNLKVFVDGAEARAWLLRDE